MAAKLIVYGGDAEEYFHNTHPYDGKEITSRIETIDLIIIDLDVAGFKSHRELDRALNNTTNNIKETFGLEVEPSIIWSGNGYHVYLPLESQYVLEDIPEFRKSEEPSKQFLRFAEWYLSGGKCDHAHNNTVSFGNCMLRIPGSHNSKSVQRNHGIANSTTEVKIISKWNGPPQQHEQRPKLSLLLGSFYAYLVDQRLAIREENPKSQGQCSDYSTAYYSHYYNRLEKLLRTPISNHRKFASHWLLSRYLINVKHKDPSHAFSLIKNWLVKCNEAELHPSQRAIDTKVKVDINDARNSGKLPIGEKILKERNESLYGILLSL